MSSFTLPDPASRPVAILGGGVLGRRIGCVWAAAGYNVHIRDPSENSRNAALQYINENISNPDYAELASGKRTPGSVNIFADLEPAVKDAWFIIEAVPEILELKIDAMAEVDRVAPKDCIIASNSSSYKSSLMVEKVSEVGKQRILNAHYQMPPKILAVEFMTDGHTDSAIFPFLTKLHGDIGLIPATARKESTGFIMNRLWAAIKREIMTILAEEVSDPGEIDKMWRNLFAAEVAPCELMDNVGLDTVAFIENNYVQERHLDTTLTLDFLRKNYIDQGKLGAKSDKGGLYPPGGPPQSKADAAAPLMYVLDVGTGNNVANPADVIHSGRVLSISSNGKTVTELVTGLPLPDGIVISTTAKRMFWTMMGESYSTNTGLLMSAALDGSDVKTIIAEGEVHTPKQITLDDQAQKLYFCDREGLRIHRCNYDGSEHEVILVTGDWKNQAEKTNCKLWCVGVSVDPEHGHIYWTQKGASKSGTGRIFRAGLEIPTGESASKRSDIELLFDNLPEPIDLEIVPATQKLYWTDRGEHPTGNSLNVAYVGGKERSHSILARHFAEAIGLRVDQRNEHVYVTDLSGTIYRCDMDGGRKKVVHKSNAAYTGLELMH